ncbi:MAG: type II toxin-antitoxin system RelE/ParE family toxin [Candidatus Pacebacteria bacterium]|nr:type II toxin-antitoxin system RelE/ParE family toxin [Candidatus Paceibacterota bacterium]
MVSLLFTPEADQEIDDIYDYSIVHWGVNGYIRYQDLLNRAFELIALNPEAPFVLKFPNLSAAIRGLPLWLVPQPDKSLRVKNPPHIIYYRIVDDSTVEILRIFHKGMNRTAILNPKK